MGGSRPAAAASPVNPSALRELKETNKALARELKRKETLAEAATLLVLQKKYQTLWEEKDG